MKKEPLSIMIVKTLLAVIIFAGMGIIIIGGVYIIGEYSKNFNNETVNERNVIPQKFYCEKDNDCLATCIEPGCYNKDYFKNQKDCEALIGHFCKCVDNECQCSEGQNDISDWQTYRNEEFGVEVRYPEKYKIYNHTGKISTVKERSKIANFIKEGQQDITAYMEYWETKEGCLSFHGSEPDFIIEANKSGYIVIDYSPGVNYPVSFELKKEWETILFTFKFIEKEEKLNWLPSNLFSFLVSSDKQKVVWTENKFEGNKMNSKLMLADLDGQNKKVLLEKDLDGENYLNPIKWSNSNEEIYFSEQYGGLGGYIIFSGPNNLSKINIQTGELERLFELKGGYIGDISPNEKIIAYFLRMDGNSKLVIKNVKTNEENIVDIPIEKGFKGGGNAHFSPDNKYLVYNIAHWDPDDEYYQTIVIGSTGEEQRVIIDDSRKIYEVMGWISDDEILLHGPDDTDYIIDINGNNLRKK